MAVVFDTVGIQSVSASLVESAEITASMEEVVVADSDSGFGAAACYDPTFEGSVSGHGDTPAACVLGGAGDGTVISDLLGNDGITIITSLKETESNSAFQTWEISYTHAPDAEAAGS